MKKYLNLGCGTNIVKEKGWQNVDNFELSGHKSFVKADITKELPFESNSIDYILLDQVLEHLTMVDIPVLLFNVKRVLKVGGKCVIIVPDFEEAAKMWLTANLNYAFEPMKYKWFSEVVYGNQEHDGEYHVTPMCAGYLHYITNMVGLNKHTISYWPTNGKVPRFPGMRSYEENALLRNAQLLVEITKT